MYKKVHCAEEKCEELNKKMFVRNRVSLLFYVKVIVD